MRFACLFHLSGSGSKKMAVVERGCRWAGIFNQGGIHACLFRCSSPWFHGICMYQEAIEYKTIFQRLILIFSPIKVHTIGLNTIIYIKKYFSFAVAFNYDFMGKINNNYISTINGSLYYSTTTTKYQFKLFFYIASLIDF